MATQKRPLRTKINYDDLVTILREAFQKIPDHRAANIVHRLPDILMSAFAIFSLKYPSILCFEQQSDIEKANLKKLFAIDKLCSDAQMRRVLDELSPQHIDQLCPLLFNKIKRSGTLASFRFLKRYYLCSIDGTRYFESRKIKCDNCQVVNHQNGETSYHHAMLAAALVHPNQRDVFPLMSETIKKQDGKNKNDCELQASKRLQNKLLEHYQKLPLVIVEDALFANEPHLQQLILHNRQFIIGVKPSKNAALFTQLHSQLQRGRAHKFTLEKDGTTHHFYWVNNVPLNNKGNIRINFLNYEEHHKGKVKKFSWVTSFKLRQSNVEQIMLGGRARWKIENETFNTLKNQGYHFEHNYGHGKKYLCDVLAKLMLLAFLMDQMVQATDKLFNDIWTAAKAKKRVWERIRAIYMVQPIKSFKELFIKLAKIFRVQLE